MIYLIHPDLTLPDSQPALNFHRALERELQQHTAVSVIGTGPALRLLDPTDQDALIFFNHEQAVPYNREVLRVLRGKAETFPVAIFRTLRIPPDPARDRQSFDVSDQLDQRGLSEANVGTVAAVLSRALLARLQPTLSQYKMRLFLSHRRADGEDLARQFYQLLKQRAEESFRDLSDVLVGEDAQDVIEERLIQSDAVIFLDTPLAYESVWVSKELEMALSLNLPIVWISLGADEHGAKLKVRPTQTPHIKRPALAFDPDTVDEAISYAFSLAREEGLRVLDTISRLRDVTDRYSIELIEESKNKLIYTLLIPRKGFRYPQRSMKHVVQFYGRWPKGEDEEQFALHLQHSKDVCDAALLLGPIPPQNFGQSVMDAQQLTPVIVDSGEEYVSNIEGYLQAPTTPVRKRGLILSGAFPDDCKPRHQQDLINAVHAFARAVFDRRGIVIFGTHPTFAPLVFDMAKRRRPKDFRDAVHLYFSAFFPVQTEDYEGKAIVFPIEAVRDNRNPRDNRNASLTRMRREMVWDREAIGLVAIGGKHPRKGFSIGVDEEMQLAREAGLPVFLIGSVQGRSSKIAADFSASGWNDKPNNLTIEQNELLRLSIDYSTLADMVLNALSL